VFADTAAHQWMGWAAGEAGRAMADAIRGAVTPQVARATLQAASATDVTELLPDVAAPTLVLHRRDMSQIPIDVSCSLAGDLPCGGLVMLDGAQPTLFMEDPGMVVGMLLAFFRDGIEPPGEPGVPTGAVGRPATSHPQPTPNGPSRRELEVLRWLAAG